MKKTILLAIAATLALTTTTAQKSDSIKQATAVKSMAKANGPDTLVIEKVKFIKIGEKVFSVSELGNPGTVTLNVPLQWIVANYQYLDNSNGGLSKKQIEELQQPLAQYYQYYMYMLQQRQQQAQPKQ